MTRRVTISYSLDYKGRFCVDVDQFDGMTPDEIEQEVNDLIAEDWVANTSHYAKHLPALVAEIVEGLKALEAERAEEEV